MIFWSAHQDTIRMLEKDEEIEISHEDEICINREAPYTKIKFHIPRWRPPRDTACVSAQKQAMAKIEEAKKQYEKEMMQLEKDKKELQGRIELLGSKVAEIKKSHTIEQVEAILTSASQAMPATATAVDRYPAAALAGSKRKAEEECKPSGLKNKKRSAATKEDVERQELQEFNKFSDKVEKARRFVMKDPTNKDSKWMKKFNRHQAVIQEASRTMCYFYARGSCRNGQACPFSHGDWLSRNAGGSGTATRRPTSASVHAAVGKAAVLTKWAPPVPGPPPVRMKLSTQQRRPSRVGGYLL